MSLDQLQLNPYVARRGAEIESAARLCGGATMYVRSGPGFIRIIYTSKTVSCFVHIHDDASVDQLLSFFLGVNDGSITYDFDKGHPLYGVSARGVERLRAD